MDYKCFTAIFPCLIVFVRSQFPIQEHYDYCDPKLKLCDVPTDHTMCKYPVSRPSSQCTPNIDEPLLSSEKDKILFWHNKFRSYIASEAAKNQTKKLPTSSNMRQMYWDSELEVIAWRWAEQCTSMTNAAAYDKCRNTKRFAVSQNVGTRRVNGTAIDKQAPQIVITWYKENKGFDPALVDKFIPNETDKVSVKQFANMIWADTYVIGCARVIFQERLPTAGKDSRSSVWTIERLVCNYGPGGNEIGKPIYKRGVACENCPEGTECSRIFPGLCAIQDNQSANKVEKNRVAAKDYVITTQSQESNQEQVTVEEEEITNSTPMLENAGNHEYGKDFHKIFRILSPHLTAREVGLAVPTQWDDFNTEIRKWLVSNSARVRRDKSKTEQNNSKKCKCYFRLQDGSASYSRNILLLLFSSFITVGGFLLYI